MQQQTVHQEDENPPEYEPPKGNPPYPHPGPPTYGPQPYPPYAPPYPHNTTLIAPSPVYARNVVSFSTYPMHVVCPFCNAPVVTSTHHASGLAVWLVAVFICCLGGFLGCCLLPFCVDGLKDVEHTCPNCNAVIGVSKRL